MSIKYSLDSLEKLKKSDLVAITKQFGIKNVQSKKKKDIINIILSFEDTSEKFIPIPVDDVEYEKIYHISDIHIRPLKRHNEYNEVFENLYNFLKKEQHSSNIIAITGDILHEKDNLKPETVIICRNFVKRLAEYGTVVIITGNHDMLENNSDRIDNLTAVFDDLPAHYLVNSGAYLFGNVVLTVSSLVDKKFIRRTQVTEKDLPVIALYHGSISGSVTDVGYVVEDTSPNSTRFRRISDFDGYDMVLLGDIHKHQYLKPHIAYPGSLVQQNFGENLKEHGVLVWDIKSKKSVFHPIENRYGFVNIRVINKKWKLPDNIPERPYIRLLVKNTDNEYTEQVKNKLEETYVLQSFKIKQITNSCEDRDILPDEVTNHQDDIDILKEEMELRKFDEEKKECILDIHKTLKAQCYEENVKYNMNNQNWKILKISFKNVFIFGENKTNVIDFTTLNGITTIVGPNAIGKSNIINIIIFLLYGSNINFKVPHILNKYQKEYFIECELMFGAKKYKIKKTGKKRKGNKLNHSFSFYIYEDKWIKQDRENNTGTAKLVKSLLGSVEQFLLTNVYSNSSLRTILTLTNSEKHKALSKLFCLDIYENLEKLAKKDVSEIKKQCSYLEGEKKGLLYNFEDGDIEKIQEDVSKLKLSYKKEKRELENILDKTKFLENEKQIVLNKKDKCVSQLQHLEDKDFNEIRNKIEEYKSKHTDTINTNVNEDIEQLKSDFYRLEGSIVKLEEIPVELNVEIVTKKKVSLDEKVKSYEGSIVFLRQKQEKTQETLNQLYRRMVSIPEKAVNDNMDEIRKFSKKYGLMRGINVQKTEQELINLKAHILNINFDKSPVPLPEGYDNTSNMIVINQIKEELSRNKKLILQNLKELEKINTDELTKYDTALTETIEERKLHFDKNMEKLKSNIKQLSSLPDIDGINTIKLVEEEIEKINQKGKFIPLNEIQKHIDYLSSFSNKPGQVLVERSMLREIALLFATIKDNIESSESNSGGGVIRSNNKLTKLLRYKELFYKNIENDKENIIINKKIDNLYYGYYMGYNKILEDDNYVLEKDLEKHNSYEYSYKYSLHEKCKKLEDMLRYQNLLQSQTEYKYFMSQKQKNSELEKECEIHKKELITIKETISNNQTEIKICKVEILRLTEIIESIHIHNNNNIILTKMKKIQDKMEKQKIKDIYHSLLLLLEGEEEYNKIKNKNDKLQIEIEKYDDMAKTLENEEVITMATHVKSVSTISSLEKDMSVKTSKLKELCNIKEKGDNLNNQLNELKKDIQLYSDYINLVNKNNIPVKLIHKKNSYLQEHINTFLENLAKFTISIDVDNKSGINFSAHKNGLVLDVNQLSGYETFILNIALKSALNKYSFISKSTLFILDEGLDVVDKDNFKKLDTLMKLLMRHYKHILLISHMPKVKDLQHNEVNIQNNGKSSYII